MSKPPSAPPCPDAKPKKRSSVRHTRAIQRDRGKRPIGAPPAAAVAARLNEIVHPATLAQVSHFHASGLRARVLNLPVMVGLVLGLLWRQLGGVSELVRVVQREALLWVPPLRDLTQQALSQRLRVLPAALFARVLNALLPELHARWQRRRRPLPPVLAWAYAHYPAVLIADGSTLDALVRKVGLLREAPKAPLAGRIMALLEAGARLPRRLWYDPDGHGHDARFWPQLLRAIPRGALVLLDRGFTDFARWQQLTAAGITWLTRAKANLVYRPEQVLIDAPGVCDRVVWIGSGVTGQRVRLIEVQAHGTVYRYLSNELDPQRLPSRQVAALYAQRWRVEEAFALTKRLLGMAYFHGGAQNAVELQVWATWMLYAVLVDLTDEIAETLDRPATELSIEMVYRSLYFLVQALQQDPDTDPVRYLAAQAKSLGILKRPRKPPRPESKSATAASAT